MNDLTSLVIITSTLATKILRFPHGFRTGDASDLIRYSISNGLMQTAFGSRSTALTKACPRNVASLTEKPYTAKGCVLTPLITSDGLQVWISTIRTQRNRGVPFKDPRYINSQARQSTKRISIRSSQIRKIRRIRRSCEAPNWRGRKIALSRQPHHHPALRFTSNRRVLPCS